MISFLAELGKKLAERWVSLFVLPGALFVGVLGVGAVLGHSNALSAGLLARRAQALSTGLTSQPVTVVLGAVGVLLAAVGAGLAARALGALVERCWLIDPPRRLAAPFVRHRRKRWDKAQKKYQNATAAPEESTADFERRRGRLAAARNQIAPAAPTHPTWIGDRVNAVDTRVYHEYGMDVTAAWPRLWLLIPEETRSTIRAARMAFTDAAALVGWSLLYLGVGLTLWWPAFLVTAVLLVLGHRRGRTSAATFADLIESVFDLHCTDLAAAVRIPLAEDQVTPTVGYMISERLRKGS